MARTCPAAALAALALALALAAPAAGLLTPDQAAAWSSYIQEAGSASYGPQSPPGALARVMGAHTFTTPLPAVLASNVNSGGASARLRRVVSDLQSGKKVKVVALGGLATNGSDASRPGRTDFFSDYVSFLAKAFPAATLKPVRVSVGLAPSSVVAACLDTYMPKDADLILLEMAANDGATMDSSVVNPAQPRAYEVLVRKLLGGESDPAVVLVQTLPPGMANGTRPFFMTPEAPHYAAVAGYYGLPYVSLRNSVWNEGDIKKAGSLVNKDVSQADGATPLDAGHAAITDGLVFMTQRTAQDLQLLPFGPYDERALSSAVPFKSMYSGAIDNVPVVLRNAACSWVKNGSVSDSGCPEDVSQMCAIDFRTWGTVKSSYAALNVAEVEFDGTPRRGNPKAALIGGVVAGVVGGLSIIGALVAYAIIKQRRKAEAEEAAFNSKFGKGPLPITASAVAY